MRMGHPEWLPHKGKTGGIGYRGCRRATGEMKLHGLKTVAIFFLAESNNEISLCLPMELVLCWKFQ